MTNLNYLKTFFEEKEIPFQLFEIENAGMTHMIDTDNVIEAILHTSTKEQQAISQTLRKLDFSDQPISGYLKFLATTMVKKFESGGRLTLVIQPAA
jgi:penicillin-binding protein-related factor A (putative recombinase)